MSYSTLMASLEPASQWALALCHFALAPELDGTAWTAAMTACKRGAVANGHRALSQEPKQEPKTFTLSLFNKGKQVRRATELQP